MSEAFQRIARSLRRRVLLMVGRAVLALVDDARKLQVVQVQGLASETLDGVERVQQYGLTSHPHPGAECVVLALGGMRQHSLVIAVDDRRYRVTGLARGEVCLYTDEDAPGSPHRITLKRGRTVHVEAASVEITSASLTHNGVNVGATHVHTGVVAGPATTGVPQ